RVRRLALCLPRIDMAERTTDGGAFRLQRLCDQAAGVGVEAARGAEYGQYRDDLVGEIEYGQRNGADALQVGVAHDGHFRLAHLLFQRSDRIWVIECGTLLARHARQLTASQLLNLRIVEIREKHAA